MAKDPKDVFIESDELDWSKVRGSILKWVRWLDESDKDVRCKTDNDELSVLFRDWVSWLNRRLDGNIWDFMKDNSTVDDFKSVFLEFYRENDEVNEKSGSNFIYVRGAGGVIARGLGNLGNEDGSGDEEVKKHFFDNLYKAGIVTDNGVDDNKLMGSIVKFVNDVDVIEGIEDDPNIEGVRQSWSAWMFDRVGNEWPTFELRKVDHDEIESWIERLKRKRDNFWDVVEDKWEFNEDLLEGNSGTDDVIRPRNLKMWEDHEFDDSVISDGKDEEDDITDVLDIELTGEDLINGDSREVVDYISEEYGKVVDAIITDVPYGQGYEGGRGDEFGMISGDKDVRQAMVVNRDVFKKSRLILNRGGMVVTTCGFDALFDMCELIDEWYNLYEPSIWYKDHIGMSQSEIKFRPNHEYILYGSNGTPKVENENRHDGSVLKFRRPSSDDRNHPTEKPISLMRYLIESFTDEGDTILDPFAGSGPTLVAAKQLGRDYIGVELSDDYYRTAKKRLNQESIGAYA